MRTLNQLTTPKSYLAKKTFDTVSGAIVGAATLKSIDGALSSALVSYLLPATSSPRTFLIASIGFATLKTAIDHYLTNQPIVSICASLLPVLGLAHRLPVEEIVTTASLGLLGTYVPSVVSYIAQHHYHTAALVASIGGEIFCSILLGAGASFYLWPKVEHSESKKPLLFLSVGLAASCIATRVIQGPHNLYLHTGLLLGVTVVSSVLEKKYSQVIGVPVRRVPEPPPPQKVVRRDPPAALSAVAPAQRRRYFSFANGIPAELRNDPIFRLFKCGVTDEPIYFAPKVHLVSNLLFEGLSRINSQYAPLIRLPKVDALIKERRKMYIYGGPVRILDRKFIREAHDELVRICPRLKIIPELKKLLDNHQTPPLMFPMESDDSSSDSDNDDSFRPSVRPARSNYEPESDPFNFQVSPPRSANNGGFSALLSSPRPSRRDSDTESGAFDDPIQFSPPRSASKVHRGLAELLSSPVQRVERDIFANGIPENLREDPIFRIFKCYVTYHLICSDPRLNPDSKEICVGDYRGAREDLIPLPKVKALLEERKRMCRLFIPCHRLDVKFVKDAYAELLRLGSDDSILRKLKELMGDNETGSESDDTSRNSSPSPVRQVQPVARGLFVGGIPARFADDCIFRLFMNAKGTILYFDNDLFSHFSKVNALIDERKQMYEQAKERELPSFRALSEAYIELRTVSPHLEVLLELKQLIELKRSAFWENNSSDIPSPASPIVVNSNNPEPISFADGIPSELEGDLIFKPFECGIGQGPSCDLVLDPTDKKTFYNRKSIHNWLSTKRTSPITRLELTRDKLTEMPKLNRLITERQEFYQKTKLPIAQALNTLPQNLNCVREAMAELEAKCPEAEACAGLRSILQSMIDQDTTQWNFAEKIPPQLRDDCVFKLFINEFTDTPIYNCVLDPDKKTFYESEWINTCLINRKNSPATGLPLKKEDLIPLSQVSLLVHQRQKFFKGLVEAKTPIEEIREHQKSCTDRKLLSTACEELKKHCGADSEIYKKLLCTRQKI